MHFSENMIVEAKVFNKKRIAKINDIIIPTRILHNSVVFVSSNSKSRLDIPIEQINKYIIATKKDFLYLSIAMFFSFS